MKMLIFLILKNLHRCIICQYFCRTPNIAWSRARKLEPPMDLPVEGNDDVTIFGRTDYRDMKVQFGIKRRDRASDISIF